MAIRTPTGDNGGMSVVACPSCATKNRVPVSAKGLPQCGTCSAKLPWLVEASDADFKDAVKTSLPVLVDLWATWCGPCKMVAPILASVAAERAGTLKVVKVDVDKNPRTQRRFEAMSIPTLVLMRDGEEVARQVGALNKAQLNRWLDQHPA